MTPAAGAVGWTLGRRPVWTPAAAGVGIARPAIRHLRAQSVWHLAAGRTTPMTTKAIVAPTAPTARCACACATATISPSASPSLPSISSAIARCARTAAGRRDACSCIAIRAALSTTRRICAGRPYRQLKTAFLYRTEYVSSCTCQPQPWDQASLDRHRLYALAAAANKGSKDAAKEMKALQAKLKEDARVAAAGRHRPPRCEPRSRSARPIDPDGGGKGRGNRRARGRQPTWGSAATALRRPRPTASPNAPRSSPTPIATGSAAPSIPRRAADRACERSAYHSAKIGTSDGITRSKDARAGGRQAVAGRACMGRASCRWRGALQLRCWSRACWRGRRRRCWRRASCSSSSASVSPPLHPPRPLRLSLQPLDLRVALAAPVRPAGHGASRRHGIRPPRHLSHFVRAAVRRLLFPDQQRHDRQRSRPAMPMPAAPAAAPRRVCSITPTPAAMSTRMVDLTGLAYSALPNAFRYRKTLVPECRCRPQPWSEAELQRHRDYAAGKSVVAATRQPDAVARPREPQSAGRRPGADRPARTRRPRSRLGTLAPCRRRFRSPRALQVHLAVRPLDRHRTRATVIPTQRFAWRA